MKILIILPTYNERKNLQLLLPKLKKYNVLVVDSNSPDKTSEIASGFKSVKSITENKMGLGSAYITGFKYAIKHNYDAVIMMDADLSHDPKYIPKLISNLKDNDFVIASRYIKGGKIQDWTFIRRLISKLGNSIARTLTKIQVKDITSGFRAIKVGLLKKIVSKKIHTTGYAFQLSLLHHSVKSGAKIIEIPFTFKDRKYGFSKLSYKDIPEFILECLQ